MKKFILILTMLSGWITTANSAASNYISNYPSSVIFTENNIEFAVFPDGQFDFYYMPAQPVRVNVQTPSVNISYNAGYNYAPYIQYDDYGAVVQIEHTPIFYDYYGRVIQIGNIPIRYNRSGFVQRVGNLRIFYNRFGHFNRFRGFINVYNRQYVYHPWHQFYRRPAVNQCIVYSQPYRRYYEPRRLDYTSYRTRRNNSTRSNYDFYRPAQRITSYSRGTRTESQRELVGNTNTTTRNARVRTNRSTTRSSNESISSRNTNRTAVNNSRNTRSETAHPSTRYIDAPNARRASSTTTIPTRNRSSSSARTRTIENNSAQRKPRAENSRTSSRTSGRPSGSSTRG